MGDIIYMDEYKKRKAELEKEFPAYLTELYRLYPDELAVKPVDRYEFARLKQIDNDYLAEFFYEDFDW